QLDERSGISLRAGQINAWDNEDCVKAVKATGKKQLVIAGVVTEVCVAFPALSALEEGYEVFTVTACRQPARNSSSGSGLPAYCIPTGATMSRGLAHFSPTISPTTATS